MGEFWNIRYIFPFHRGTSWVQYLKCFQKPFNLLSMSFRTNRFEHILILRPSSKTIFLSTNPIFSVFQYLVAIHALGLHYTRRPNIFGIYLLNLLSKFMVKTNLRIPPKNTLLVDLRSAVASRKSPKLRLLILRGKNIDILYNRVYRATTDRDGFWPRKSVENTFQRRDNIFRTTTPSSAMNGISKKNPDLGLWMLRWPPSTSILSPLQV